MLLIFQFVHLVQFPGSLLPIIFSFLLDIFTYGYQRVVRGKVGVKRYCFQFTLCYVGAGEEQEINS